MLGRLEDIDRAVGLRGTAEPGCVDGGAEVAIRIGRPWLVGKPPLLGMVERLFFSTIVTFVMWCLMYVVFAEYVGAAEVVADVC